MLINNSLLFIMPLHPVPLYLQCSSLVKQDSAVVFVAPRAKGFSESQCFRGKKFVGIELALKHPLLDHILKHGMKDGQIGLEAVGKGVSAKKLIDLFKLTGQPGKPDNKP